MSQITNIKPSNSRAYINRTVSFGSFQAQKVMTRSYDALRRSLFQLSVILRIISSNEAEIEKIDQYVEDQFTTLQKELAVEQARIKKILEDNGIEDYAVFSKPEKFEPVIDSRRANTFLRLIGDLDELMVLIETAWLTGEFDDRQRRTATLNWQQRLIKLAARIIALENRARNAATKKGKDDQVQEQAPATTDEHSTEVKEAVLEVEKDMPELAVAV